MAIPLSLIDVTNIVSPIKLIINRKVARIKTTRCIGYIIKLMIN